MPSWKSRATRVWKSQRAGARSEARSSGCDGTRRGMWRQVRARPFAVAAHRLQLTSVMSPRLRPVVLAFAASLALAACHERSEQRSDDRAAATAVKQQDRFRVLLRKELVWADRRIDDVSKSAATLDGNARAVAERDLDAARAWRQRLQDDLDAIDRPPPGMDWPALEKRIKRDLDEDRPPSMPKMYEKPYGI